MFDVLTTGAVADELRRTVRDGRIQRLGLVDAVTFAVELYSRGRRWHLIASAHSQNARVHLTRSMPSIDPDLITPFGLQLRKYVRGGFLIGIEQPPLERVIRLSIAKRMAPLNASAAHEQHEADEMSLEDDIWAGESVERVDLFIEIMGRHSNLVLVDADGLVRESAKRVTSSMSRVRPMLPKIRYTLPPPPMKPDPRQATSPSVHQLLAAATPDAMLSDLLIRGYRGVSPQIAREAAFRVANDPVARVGDLRSDSAGEIAQVLRALFQPLLTNDWQPHLYEKDNLATGYGAVPITYLATEGSDILLDSISLAIERFEDDSGTATPQDHAQRRARLVQGIDAALQSVDTRIRSLNQQYERSGDTERLRRWGDAIYSYLWRINPEDRELIVETEVGEETIPLRPPNDPKHVAREYFEEYRKAQKAGHTLPERIEAAENARRYLDQLRTQSEQAEGFASIEALRQELEEHTGSRGAAKERSGARLSKNRKARRVAPIADVSGNMIYIGHSGRDNEHITFDIAGPDDLWLHARGVPGSHVIVRMRRPSEGPHDDVIETAASLAAYYSRSRQAGIVEVDLTQRRHVRKIKGSGPGMVTYRNEQTVAVRPTNEQDLRKRRRIL